MTFKSNNHPYRQPKAESQISKLAHQGLCSPFSTPPTLFIVDTSHIKLSTERTFHNPVVAAAKRHVSWRHCTIDWLQSSSMAMPQTLLGLTSPWPAFFSGPCLHLLGQCITQVFCGLTHTVYMHTQLVCACLLRLRKLGTVPLRVSVMRSI